MTAVLDPLAPGHRGWWECDEVLVCHEDSATLPSALSARLAPSRVTARFKVYELGRRVLVTHRYRPDDLDDDLAGHLAAELRELAEYFELLFTGVVRSTVGDPLLAWTVFYANTLAALRSPARTGAIASFAPVHARALSLVRGRSVLDVGSCFGFLPLQMLARGLRPIASDVSAGTMSLLARVSSWFGTPLPVLACDAAALPLGESTVDTVTAIHLLEHLPPAHGAAALREMLRVARRRVVVAVPFEPEPDPAFGHVRCFGFAELCELGRASGVRFTVFEHHGGWLVLDAG